MPGYSGRCTAPLMVDCKTQTIVSNESEDIVRMLNDFDLLDENQTQDDTHPLIVDLYPPQLRNQIDTANEWIYKSINNGVYRCGFSTSQEGYDRAIKDVTQGLDKLEEMLSKSRFLLGDKVTESDIRLLPTMARFDSVYNPFFKCTTRTIKSMPNIQGWLQDMYQIPGVPETLDLDDAIRSYYSNLFPLNPSGIVAKGPPFNTTDPKRGSHVKQDLFYDKAERSSSSSP
uniref:GST C-terminal domain-containing protein n=2 Tax=Amorphochlora amoebiformis TaxID=1561963 RepID=A0A7S0DF75_9EUKA|mmetsp:Transcript_24212/g.38150  ORF Transcript_24212/g.38150 Transcript_24212/m.38150 type:complete len:229 (+) Transcript_24212:641-1327(+)